VSLPAGFDGPLRRWPDAPALSFGEERWTWSDLADRVEARQRALAAAGVAPGNRVVIPAGPGPQTVVSVWATLAAGAHAVPIAPELPAPERARRSAAVRAGFVADVDGVRRLADRPGPPRHAPGEPALLVFTSGTTGPARAAVLSLPALVASADGVVAGTDLRPGDAWLDPLPLSHVGGLGVPFRAARAGAEAVLTAGFDPEAVAALLADGRITHASLVARMLDRLLHRGLQPRGLRCVLVGGGRTDPDLLARARAVGVPAVATYGLSEAGSTVTLQRADRPVGGAGDAGWPLPGRGLRIGDDDAIQIGGPSLMLGYDDGPPVGPWLATGDRGRILPDGRLEVLDRRVDLVVTGGENVSPAEVEAALARVDGVVEVCVVGLPHPSWGQELVAVVRWAGPPRADLLELAAAALAPWQRPRRWIQHPGPLPRTALGKLQRERVREELLGPDPR
jgi:O-succinylbenzoic acid--CoA ligase